MLEQIANEYRRILNLEGGWFGTRDQEMKNFKHKLYVMKHKQIITAQEWDDIQNLIRMINRDEMISDMQRLANL